MASKTRHGDRHRRRPPAAQSGQRGPEPTSRSTDDKRSPQDPQSLPDDGGAECDRGTVVTQDRNFDSGPAPK